MERGENLKMRVPTIAAKHETTQIAKTIKIKMIKIQSQIESACAINVNLKIPTDESQPFLIFVEI